MVKAAQYLPHGVIPALLLPFSEDLSIDETSFRHHVRDVAAVDGISAVTINAHASEVASCTFEEQRHVTVLEHLLIVDACRPCCLVLRCPLEARTERLVIEVENRQEPCRNLGSARHVRVLQAFLRASRR